MSLEFINGMSEGFGLIVECLGYRAQDIASRQDG